MPTSGQKQKQKKLRNVERQINILRQITQIRNARKSSAITDRPHVVKPEPAPAPKPKPAPKKPAKPKLPTKTKPAPVRPIVAKKQPARMAPAREPPKKQPPAKKVQPKPKSKPKIQKKEKAKMAEEVKKAPVAAPGPDTPAAKQQPPQKPAPTVPASDPNVVTEDELKNFVAMINGGVKALVDPLRQDVASIKTRLGKVETKLEAMNLAIAALKDESSRYAKKDALDRIEKMLNRIFSDELAAWAKKEKPAEKPTTVGEKLAKE